MCIFSCSFIFIICIYAFVWQCQAYGPDPKTANNLSLMHSSLKAQNSNIKKDEPIVLLHGLLGSSRNFRTIEKLLHDKLEGLYDIICVDARNHGQSAFLGPFVANYELMSNDIINTLNNLNVDKFHLVGHSMGGKIASMTALNHPDRVKSLCVLDMAPIEYSEQEFKYVSTIITKIYSIQNALLTTDNKKEVISLLKLDDDPVMQSFLESNLIVKDSGSGSGRFCEWRFQIEGIYQSLQNFREFPVKNTVSSYPNPTLFLKGGNSDYVRMRHIEDIQALFDNYHIHTIREAGHWLHFEKPSETVEFVSRLIKSTY